MWIQTDSNCRDLDLQSSALPTELQIHYGDFMVKSPNLQDLYYGVYSNVTRPLNHCGGGGIRTHVIWLMRPSWNLLQSTPHALLFCSP